MLFDSLLTVYLLLLSSISVKEVRGRVCHVAVTVDESLGEDCSSLLSLPQNVTCNSLSDTLQLISQSASGEEEDDCLEVVINQGHYTVEGTVILERSLLIRGRGGDSVSVNLLLPAMDPPQFIYSLSFRNADFAGIDNIAFSGSSGVIGFDNVTTVEVGSSSFHDFLQGAVDVYNSYDVTVLNCTFEDNGPVMITKYNAWRGHAGGLSVAFNFLSPLNSSGITTVITDCTFRNNSVRAAVSGRQTTSQLLRRFIATGRGGGCAVNLNSVTSAHVEVTRCRFEMNYALTYGGGLYLAWNVVSGHRTVLNDIVFIENQCPGGAGGLELGFARGGTDDISNELYASNLHFIRNMASYGGGVYVFIASRRVLDGGIGNFVSFEDCLFEGNTAVEYGGAVGLILPSANVIFDNRDRIRPIMFTNCSFTGNSGGRGGTVSTSYLPLRLEGAITFSKNRGTSLTILGTLVRLRGQMAFLNNDAGGNDGGALNAISLGQVEIARGSKMIFSNNSGNLGAGIVVNSIYVPQLYNELLYDPLCVLLQENRTLPLNAVESDEISIEFSGNRALVGSAVYTNRIGLCSWTGELSGDKVYFNKSLAFRWNFTTYSDDNRNSAHCPDDANPRYYVQTQEGELTASTNFTGYPGESAFFGVKTIDDLDLPTISVLRFTNIDKMEAKKENSHDVEFVPSVITLNRVNQAGVNLSLLVNTSKGADESEAVIESLLQNTVVRIPFNVTISPCPLGYAIFRDAAQPDLNICSCDLENGDIVNCNGLSIQIKDGYWASSPMLEVYPCPYEYCRCHMESETSGKQRCLHVVDGTNPNSQCACNRNGVLCGSCDGSSGFSAILNQCVSCSNLSGLFIAALVILDVIIYIFLLLLSLQFPSFLFPCLFYLQILPFLAEHFSPTFTKAYFPLYYITSASSFYFIYDFCLLNNLSPLLSYLFRYIPFFIALVVCPAVIFTARCWKYWYVKADNRRLKKWAGIWWIIILLYSHLVYTSMTVLNCPSIPASSVSRSRRWYVSGDVECFQGYHLPLALLAIATLLACILVIPLTALLSMEKVKCCFDVPAHLSKPLTRPFKLKYRWWSAVELARRFLLILFIVPFPENNYPAMIVICVLIVVTGFTWPYADIASNLLDILLSVNVLILLLIKNTRQIEDSFNDVSFNEVVRTNGCIDYELNLSTQSAILVPFYYFPLLVLIVASGIWIAMSIRQKLKSRKTYTVVEKHEFTTSDSFVKHERAPTLSELNFNDEDTRAYPFADVSYIPINQL